MNERKLMAKLIYENDNGQQVTFEVAEDLAKTLETDLGVMVWNEFMQVLKEEIVAQGKLK